VTGRCFNHVIVYIVSYILFRFVIYKIDNLHTSYNVNMFCSFIIESLQEYVLYCCQSPHGGLMDKPGKGKDFYHTCYCLSGLSVAQHSMGDHVTNITSNPRDILVPTHPLFNIPIIQVTNTTKYFSSLHTMTSNDSI
jgi:protein farnesyltransferase subunit beta